MNDMNKLINYCKQYGFIYQGSEIYGGLANTWDYGPLGSKLKNNIKESWRQHFINENKNAVEIDAGILMHPKVWEASGHVGGFQDPLVDCKECKMRYRVDTLINEFDSNVNADAMNEEEMANYIKNNKVTCPNCKASNFTEIREFSLMFKTQRGVTKDNTIDIYLRPENAQGEYVNFLNVLRTSRTKLPFSIGQIGKAFRNEITPGNFTFRTLEFEQMEFQTFCKPGTDMDIYEKYKEIAKRFYLRLGIDENKLRFHDHEKLIFYAKAACDIEYQFPFGWGELNGTHNRTDYDLSQHQKFSGQSMVYNDVESGEKYVPYIVESTVGLDRTFLCTIVDSYCEEIIEENKTREVLKLHPYLAPYKVAILPLIKKEHSEKANELFEMLSKKFAVIYDEAGSIGKRYRRQDIIGTPFCITIDSNTLSDNTVTIRNRDTMQQETIAIAEIIDYVSSKIEF